MSDRDRSWRVRVAFEPNRFASEQLERAYEHLKPMDGQETRKKALPMPETTTPSAAKGGGK